MWFHLLRPAHLQHLVPTIDSDLIGWWLSSRKRIPKSLRRGFDSLYSGLLVLMEGEESPRFQSFDGSGGQFELGNFRGSSDVDDGWQHRVAKHLAAALAPCPNDRRCWILAGNDRLLQFLQV